MKASTREKLIFTLATKFGWLFILLLGRLTRVELVGRHYWRELRERGVSFIVLTWHGRILLPIYLHRRERIKVMVSLHGDGEMIAQTIHRLGYQTIRGSSTRGGKQAFHEMVAALRQGAVGAIMPDGPKGPRHQFKPGALYIAQQAGAYLLPLTFSSSRKIQLGSWDRFTLWWPFSISIALYGQPVFIPPEFTGEQVEQLRAELESRMIQMENEADAYFRK